ncbi:hypothetical protein [Halobacterium litoreum]|uniref:DUF1918 domain-containing protein n=1 Tax=Halobacterium litoreum TaxID=2039234 RepID=A0ABD5NEN9_9EURY|nr:hypothetical protein [Halobacterium litoreum]UHH13475.1 hypothetical protein LT972_00420 [Halobacterium litoreum]
MKRSFWPAQKTHVTIPKEIEGVEIVARRWGEDGEPQEARIEVRGSRPTSAVVYEGEHAPEDAQKLLTDDERGVTYHVVWDGGN